MHIKDKYLFYNLHYYDHIWGSTRATAKVLDYHINLYKFNVLIIHRTE